ncbi:MAG: hypothetical protein AAFU78_22835 [Cyanobacteria bacterium J06633_2]
MTKTNKREITLSVTLDDKIWSKAPDVLPTQNTPVVIYVTAARLPQIAMFSDEFDGWALVTLGKKTVHFEAYQDKEAEIYWSASPMNKMRLSEREE